MSYRHSARRSKRVDDRVIGNISNALGRASESELQAVMTQHLRARNLRATFRRAADIAISHNAGLPVEAEFHEGAIKLWPDEVTVMTQSQTQIPAEHYGNSITEQLFPLTDQM